MTSEKSPWREAAIYQIYPWTFNEDKERTPYQDLQTGSRPREDIAKNGGNYGVGIQKSKHHNRQTENKIKFESGDKDIFYIIRLSGAGQYRKQCGS